MRFSVSHISCPSCGGTLGVREGERLVDCPYCKGRNLIWYRDYVARFILKNRIRSNEVSEIVERALRHRSVPRELLKKAEFQLPQLFYIPFYELNAKHMGRIILRKGTKRVRSGEARMGPDGRLRYYDFEGRPIEEHEYYKRKVVENLDSKIVMKDFYHAGPASRLEGWGLSRIDLRALRLGEEDLDIQPFQPEEAQKEGIVFNPDIPRDRYLEAMELPWDRSSDRVEMDFSEKDLGIVYYPVWMARYTYEGKLYLMTVDGWKGEILEGRAPEASTAGATAMILVAAYLGLPLSKLLRHVGDLKEFLVFFLHPVGILLGIVVLILLLIPLSVAWSSFRYLGEVVFHGASARVVKLNLPASTWMDRAIDGLMGFLTRAAEEAMKKQRNRPW